jgi:predicted RNase H-like nuclease (RuvC/YqgF family)
LVEKCKKLEENAGRASRAIENEKALQKAISALRKTVNEKETEIEQLKGQLKTSSNIGTSNSLLGTP